MFYSRHLDSESHPTLILCTTTMKDRLFLRLSEFIGWPEMVYPQTAVLEAPLDSMSCTPNNITHLVCHILPVTSSTHPLILRHGLMNLQKMEKWSDYGNVLLVHGSHLAGCDVR